MATVLGTKRESYAGDFVLQNQEVASKQGFGHVSKIWFNKTMSFDDGLSKLSEQQGVIKDVMTPLSEWRTSIVDDKFSLEYVGDNNDVEQTNYHPTERAMSQLATYGGMRGGTCWDLTQDKRDNDDEGGEIKVKRGRCDAEVLKMYFDTNLFNAERTPQDKPRFIRTWNNNHSIRAFLSDRYGVVNNEWFLQVLKELIPGGRLSHWRGDADSIWGNVLIPDTIRQEKDSDYGGMLSVSNSEVGERRIFTQPSVFRAICMNGCIWNREDGKSINKKHLGEINLGELRSQIEHNLTTQIPLLNQGIERMLGIRAYGCGDVHVTSVIAEVCQSNKIPKSFGKGILTSFLDERNVLDKDADSLFGIVGAITRFGQTQENKVWYDMDCLGGELTNLDIDGWSRIKSRAKELREKDIEKIFGLAI